MTAPLTLPDGTTTTDRTEYMRAWESHTQAITAALGDRARPYDAQDFLETPLGTRLAALWRVVEAARQLDEPGCRLRAALEALDGAA